MQRQCVQENLAADVHNTFHFNQTSSYSCGRVACQEDNTMAEREKHHRGARHVLGWLGGSICGGQWCAANPAYQVCRMSYEQNNTVYTVSKVFTVCGCMSQ